MKRHFVQLSMLLALWSASIAEAETWIDVSIHNATVAPGGMTTIEVWLAARNGNINLAGFSFELGIDPQVDYGIDSVLEFIDFDDDSILPYAYDERYVFVGATADGPYGMALLGEDDFENYNLGWFGADFADDGYVMLTEGTDYLLARLNLQHWHLEEHSYNPLGHRFTIALLDTPNTTFWDSDDGEISFTSSSGTVSVVPEPSSVWMLAGLSLWAVAYSRRRRRPGRSRRRAWS